MNQDNALAEKILFFLRDEAMTRYPAFPEAFGQLYILPRPGISAPMATDGLCLFYDPCQVISCFDRNPDYLRESFLHLHLHCLSGHLIQGCDQDPGLWMEACDLSVSLLLTHLDPSSASAKACRDLMSKCALRHRPDGGKAQNLPDAHSLMEELNTTPGLKELARSLFRDSHEFWFRPSAKTADSSARITGYGESGEQPGEGQPALPERVRRVWQAPAKQAGKEWSKGQGRHGHSAGRDALSAALTAPSGTDYRRFLRRFTVPREEAVLDMDSFDYIPYHLGLTVCGNMPFIEPLEYQEVNRLDELAIAIDTSGSCSGRIVRRFLEETWRILRQKENFFSRMRLHLIQCDSTIQDYRVFTSAEEWEAALPELSIRGFGDTDFRPVFTLLNRLIAEKAIRRLRGLLYFTDGDGIFPAQRPSYETAFVFLNRALEKHDIPDWGIRLNLELPDNF